VGEQHLPRRLKVRPPAWSVPRLRLLVGMLATVMNAINLQMPEPWGGGHPGARTADLHAGVGGAYISVVGHSPLGEGPCGGVRSWLRQPPFFTTDNRKQR